MTTTIDDKTTQRAEDLGTAPETSPATKKTGSLKEKLAAKKPAASTTPKQKKSKGERQGVWKWLFSGLPSVPISLRSVLIRVGTVAFDAVLATFMAFSLIPQLGAYLYQESVAMNDFNMSGIIAIWGMPLLFIVAILTVLYVVVTRALWRVGSRHIEKVKAARAQEQASRKAVPSRGSGSGTRPKKKTNRK